MTAEDAAVISELSLAGGEDVLSRELNRSTSGTAPGRRNPITCERSARQVKNSRIGTTSNRNCMTKFSLKKERKKMSPETHNQVKENAPLPVVLYRMGSWKR